MPKWHYIFVLFFNVFDEAVLLSVTVDNDLSEIEDVPKDVDCKVGIHGLFAVFVTTLAAPSTEDFSPVSTVGRIGEPEAVSSEDPAPCGAASPTPGADTPATLITVFSAMSFSASLSEVETSAVRLAALR